MQNNSNPNFAHIPDTVAELADYYDYYPDDEW